MRLAQVLSPLDTGQPQHTGLPILKRNLLYSPRPATGSIRVTVLAPASPIVSIGLTALHFQAYH